MENMIEQDENDENEIVEQNKPTDLFKETRRALFAAVEGEGGKTDEGLLSHSPFVSLFSPSEKHSFVPDGSNAKEVKEHLLECLGSFHKGHARRFFAGLKAIVERVIVEELYVPESAYQDENGSKEDNKTTIPNSSNTSQEHDPALAPVVIPDQSSSTALQFLHLAALSIQAYMDAVLEKHKKTLRDTAKRQQLNIIIETTDIVILLHDILFFLDSCGPDAVAPQTTILKLCESWWHANGPQKQNLVVQALPLLVIQALGEHDKPQQKKDIRRLQAIQDAFHLIDFSNPTSDSLRSLLLRTMSSPLFLRMNEGKRFLSGLLLDSSEAFVKHLHLAIRAQIPGAKKTIVKAYGEVYFKAWMQASDMEDPTMRERMEHVALNDLMFALIHMASVPMRKSLELLLEPFHQAKKNPKVEHLLYRMYGPILWRSLTAANALVRINATIVLAEVFPLRDPSTTQTGTAVEKSMMALQSLLRDKDPRVRQEASKTAAKILSTFWDVIPTADLRTILNCLIGEHAMDASSSLVRVGALNSVAALLDASCTHAVLRALLPSLGNLIHDKVERVRVAAARLLLKVKDVPDIKFYHVVPVDHLKARLAAEGQLGRKPVASELTLLLLNSYLPQGVSGVEQVKRTLSFLSSDPKAAAVFYSHVYEFLPAAAVAKLTAMLLRCLTSAVETDQQESKKRNRKRRRSSRLRELDTSIDDDDEGGDDQQTLLTASNTTLMASLAETICVLWETIEDDLALAENEECKAFLLQAFSGTTITKALRHFEQKTDAFSSERSLFDNVEPTVVDDCYRTCSALLRCAGRLQPQDIDGLVPHISSLLLSIVDSNEDRPLNGSVSAHIALLCLWGMTDEVSRSLALSIRSPFAGAGELNLSSPQPGTKKRRSVSRRQSSESLVLPSLPPVAALDVLSDILRGSDASSIAARNSIFGAEAASSRIEEALERGTDYAGRLLMMTSTLTQTMTDGDVEYIIRLCEAFGRLALHKAAFRDGGDVGFSKDAKLLFQWTTEKVIPALKNAKESSLFELDISRISFSDDVDLSQHSIAEPMRKKGSMNMTPEKLDGSSLQPKDRRRSLHGQSATMLVSSAGTSLLYSTCAIFSEWLAVGGAGAQEIAEAACSWCSVLKDSPDDLVQAKLLPAFLRLALFLCRTDENFQLFKEVLIICSPTDEQEISLVKKMVSSLLSMRSSHGNDLLCGTVEAVLDIAYAGLPSESNPVKLDVPSSIADVCSDGDNLSFAPCCLDVIFSSRPASLEVSRVLTRNFNESPRRPHHSIFTVKCLWMLCELKTHFTWGNVLEKLNLDDMPSENIDLLDLMKSLVSDMES